MFILKKCDFEDCTRTGYVALKEGDTVCNIHKNKNKNKNGEGNKNNKNDESDE